MSMRALLKSIDQNGERWLLLPMYTMIVLTVVVEVFRRFVLSYSSIWGEEIARFMFIYISWIGASLCIRDRQHIRIDIFTHLLSERFRGIFYIFGDLLAMALAVVAIYFSMEQLIRNIEFGVVTHGLRIERAWFLAAVPLGFLMVFFRLIQSIIRDMSDVISGRPLFKGVKIIE
jgi:TRAP-type C4-dicarboxylate transport system permease small subunit